MREWVQHGAGAESLFEQSQAWNTEDQYLRALKGRVEEKLKQVGAVMQSKSGEAMQNQAMPIALWTEVTADSAKLQSEQLTAQGDAFKKVQSSIPAKSEEQPIPDDSWLEEGWDTFWTGSTDADDAKAHNEQLRQEAVQAFSTYQETSQNNVSGSAVFTPPPDGGMQTTVSGSHVPGSGGVHQPSSTSSASAGGSGYAGGSGAGSAGGYSGGGSLAGAGAGSGGAGSLSPAGSSAAWATPTPNPAGTGMGAGATSGTGQGGMSGLAGGMSGAPGMGAGGRAGSGTGTGGSARGGAGGRGVGSGGAGRGPGAGGRAGAGGLAEEGAGSGRSGQGGRGGAGAGGAGARGRGQEGEDDLEHETPDFLIGDQGVFDEDLPRVAPPVFGDWENKQ